jgi:hypothetical protein
LLVLLLSICGKKNKKALHLSAEAFDGTSPVRGAFTISPEALCSKIACAGRKKDH